eukprot:9143500-Pyramimonas_sp.AAC.1
MLTWRGRPRIQKLPFPATDEEVQLVLCPRATGNPTDMELCDDDSLRGSPRDASAFSGRVQCELSPNEEFQ